MTFDAYRYPQATRPGCTHQLGCKCTPPFWLRASSPTEDARIARRFGLDCVRVPGPSAICGWVGCTRQDEHSHEVT